MKLLLLVFFLSFISGSAFAQNDNYFSLIDIIDLDQKSLIKEHLEFSRDCDIGPFLFQPKIPSDFFPLSISNIKSKSQNVEIQIRNKIISNSEFSYEISKPEDLFIHVGLVGIAGLLIVELKNKDGKIIEYEFRSSNRIRVFSFKEISERYCQNDTIKIEFPKSCKNFPTISFEPRGTFHGFRVFEFSKKSNEWCLIKEMDLIGRTIPWFSLINKESAFFLVNYYADGIDCWFYLNYLVK